MVSLTTVLCSGNDEFQPHFDSTFFITHPHSSTIKKRINRISQEILSEEHHAVHVKSSMHTKTCSRVERKRSRSYLTHCFCHRLPRKPFLCHFLQLQRQEELKPFQLRPDVVFLRSHADVGFTRAGNAGVSTVPQQNVRVCVHRVHHTQHRCQHFV